MSYFPPTGSVVTFQSQPSSMLVGASIFGQAPVNIVGVSGTSMDVVTSGADNQSNTNNQLIVGSFGYVYNQTTGEWERLRGTSSIGALVSTGASSVIATGTVSVVGGDVGLTTALLTPGDAFSNTNIRLPANAAGSIYRNLVLNYGFNGTSWDRMKADAVSGTLTSVYGTVNVSSVVTTNTVPGTPFRYQGSIVSTSVTVIAPSVAGQRHYITDFKFANTGSVATLVTFQDGSTSILGYTIAPATGGSNYTSAMVPDRAAPSQDLAFKPGTAVSILYATVSGYTV